MTASDKNTPTILITHIHGGNWIEHPRFRNIFLKSLISSQDNPLANVNTVRVPPGGLINDHSHGAQVETIFVIQGEAVLHFHGEDHAFNAGSIVAMPAGIPHSLRNDSDDDVYLLTFFTPPL
jgi:quercetin dioxygenase-like cupin family protein